VEIRQSVFQELNTLSGEFNLLREYPGNIAAGSGEASHVAQCQGIVVDGDHYDWQRTGDGHRRSQDGFGRRKDDVDLAAE
jgi:hypothetical protein